MPIPEFLFLVSVNRESTVRSMSSFEYEIKGVAAHLDHFVGVDLGVDLREGQADAD